MDLRRAMKGSTRGASPLGGMIMAITVTLIAIFGLTGWMGSYQIQNGSPINPLLANTVDALYANPSGPQGAIFGTGQTFNSVSGQAVANANSTKGIIGAVSAAASAAGTAFSFLGTIANFVNPFNPGNFVNVFVIGPLIAVGVQAQYAAFLGYAAVVAMLLLLVLSALLIFNLL